MAKAGPLIVEPISEMRPVIVLPPVSSLVPPWAQLGVSGLLLVSIFIRFDPTVRRVSKGKRCRHGLAAGVGDVDCDTFPHPSDPHAQVSRGILNRMQA